MKFRLYVFIAAIALAVITANPAAAIIGGQPDGNGHPNVGALDLRPIGFPIPCSGTLISPTVYVTAGHCTNFLESRGITQARVTFDPVVSDTARFYTGVLHTNPGFFTGSASDPGDVGVVVFATPIQGITPAPLPPAGLLDQLGPRGLKAQTFVQVGYGVSAPLVGGSSPPQPDPSSAGTRRVATETFNSLTPTILYLSAINDGTPCTGDSGSPQFLGSTIVAEGHGGDEACTALTTGYRLDTPSARAFLAHYVSLP
jgi:Trypsin